MSEGVATFTAGTFSARLGERFGIEVDSGEQVDLELIAVTELGASTPGRRESYSIVFHDPTERVLPQRIYRLEHAELGAFELFLVPIAPGTYEAIFT